MEKSNKRNLIDSPGKTSKLKSYDPNTKQTNDKGRSVQEKDNHMIWKLDEHKQL